MWNVKNTFGISKRSHPIKPIQEVARNQNMGIRMEKKNWQNKWMGNMAMGECEDWQRKSYIVQTNCKHYEGGYGKLPLGDVYTCLGFLARISKFEKVDSITFFYELIVNEGFGNPWEPPLNIIYGTQ